MREATTPSTKPATPSPARGETFWFLSLSWDVDTMNQALDVALLTSPERILTTTPERLKGGMLTEPYEDHELEHLEHPERPVIVLSYAGQARVYRFIADGNHRLQRALKLDLAEIRVFVISPEDEPRYRSRR